MRRVLLSSGYPLPESTIGRRETRRAMFRKAVQGALREQPAECSIRPARSSATVRCVQDLGETEPTSVEAGSWPGSQPRLFAVLVTFNRPSELSSHLATLTAQTQRIDHLVVVDNAGDSRTEEILAAHPGAAVSAEALPMADNLGPAGGLAHGLRRVLELVPRQATFARVVISRRALCAALRFRQAM